MSTNKNKDHIGAVVIARTLALHQTSSNLARRAIQGIDRLTSDPRVTELIRQMAGSSATIPNLRIPAWKELRKMGPTYRGWAESLRNMIYTGHGWSKILSAEALSCFSCHAEDAVPALAGFIEAFLDAKEYDLGAFACSALSQFKMLDSKLVENVLPILIRVIEETKNYNADVKSDERDMRLMAIFTLGNYGNLAESALLKLAPFLEHRGDPLWKLYFRTSQLIDPRAKSQIDALVVLLSSKDATARAEAVCLIMELGSKGISAIPGLLPLVNDDSVDVRRFLAVALDHFGQKTSEIIDVLNALTLDTDDRVKVVAFHALLCLLEDIPNNLHGLLSFLSHNDPFVRKQSMQGVYGFGFLDKAYTISCLKHALRVEKDKHLHDLILESLDYIYQF